MQWCVENSVPLTFFQGRTDIFVVFYERLVTTLDHELGRIVEALGLEPRREAPMSSAGPSITAHRAKDFDFESALGDWQRGLSTRDVSRAMETLTAFGLDALYGTEPMPRDVDPLNVLSS